VAASRSLRRQLQGHHNLKKKAVNGTIDKARPCGIPSLPGNQTFLIISVMSVGARSALAREGNEQHTPPAEPTFPFWHVAWDALSAQFGI